MHSSSSSRCSAVFLAVFMILLQYCQGYTKSGVPPTAGIANGADISFPIEEVHHHHHHHHYHDVDDDREGMTASRLYPPMSMNASVVPIDFYRSISSRNVSDLLLNFVDDYEDDIYIGSRFGEDVERSPAITPKPAACMPELRTVPLITSPDPTVIYLPSCTRIEQCGGCCSVNLLACQPIETEVVSFKVVKTQYTSGNRLKFVGKEVAHLERHTKCACGCKIKETDCNTFQEYNPAECRCACANHDEEKKCYKNNVVKIWDPESCTCRCKQISQCSTGYTFDHNGCKCIPIPVRRRFVAFNENDTGKQDVLPGPQYETSDIDA